MAKKNDKQNEKVITDGAVKELHQKPKRSKAKELKESDKLKKKEKKEEKESRVKVRFYRTIKAKLIFAVLLPVFFIILLGVVSYIKASDGIISGYQSSVSQAINMTGEYFSFVLDSTSKEYNSFLVNEQIVSYANGKLKEFTSESATIRNSNKDTFFKSLTGAPFLGNVYILTDDVDSILTTNTKGTNLYSAMLATPQGAEAAAEPSKYFWYGVIDSVDQEMGTSSDKYALRMIRKYKKANAFVVVDLKRDAVLSILNRLDMGDGAIWGLVTRDDYEIVTTGLPDEENKGQDDTAIPEILFTDKDYYKAALASEDSVYVQEVNYQGNVYLYINAKAGTSGASINALIPKGTIVSQADEIKQITICIVIVASIIATLVGILIATGMGNTLKMMMRQINKVAKGDLTVRIHTKRKDEFSILAKDMSDMIAHTKHLIQRVEYISQNLNSVAVDINGTSGEFVHSSENIKTAISEIETGVIHQAEDSQHCLKQMDSLSGKIERLNDNTKRINDIVNVTGQTIEKGISYMDTLNEKAKSTTDVTGSVITTIEELEVKSRSISSIVGAINEISEQTNLLSLNASIEAARAGESGRGFAVVADEIRKLADQSLKSAGKINDIIEEIIENTKAAVKTAKKAEAIVKEQEGAVNDTTVSFNEMDQQVIHLMDELKQILNVVTDIDNARSNTLGAIEDISAVSEETATSSSTVSTAASNQVQAVTQLDDMAKQLSDYAQELTVSVSQFIINEQ